MQRKTNLFYLSGEDSNFITFSNYAESLTGNFLSTDTKIYPTQFLCMQVNWDNVDGYTYDDKRTAFIKYLAQYLENKLAVLRDYCSDNDINAETKLMPLNYLLETFLNYFCDSDINNYGSNEDTAADTWKINYIGTVTEQDYNGIYADTICLIDDNDYKCVQALVSNTDNTSTEYVPVVNTDTLYGWDGNRPSYVDDLKPVFDLYNGLYSNIISDDDTEEGYYITSALAGMQLIDSSELTDATIKFNIIVPLYDVIDINYYNTTTTTTANPYNINAENFFDLTSGTDAYVKNVPLGIWFADTADGVSLTRNSALHYQPSWSLVLSSQFKPFPYSDTLYTEMDNTGNADAFATYAEILTRQNSIIEKMNTFSEKIATLSEQVNDIVAKINTATQYNVDNIQSQIIELRQDLANSYAYTIDYVNSISNQYVWKNQE